MTRIYEALERASKKRRDEEPQAPSLQPVNSVFQTKRSAVPSISKALSPQSVVSSLEIRLEQTLTSLYTTIDSQLPGEKGKTVEFLAAHPGAGTSTLVREFAKVAAVKLKKSVLLLDADHHKPTQVVEFSIDQPEGLDTMLKQGKDIGPALFAVGNSGLSVSQLVSQHSGESPLFDSPQFLNMLKRLKESFDLILIDAPPATMYSEGLTLASKVDGVVMVIEAEKTRWQVMESVRDRIILGGGNILGAVLNKRRDHIPNAIYDRL